MAQMAQVVTSGTSGTGRSGSPELRGTSGTRTRGPSDSVEKVEQGQGVCPAEPLHLTQCGTTRPCKFHRFVEEDSCSGVADPRAKSS